MYTFPDTVSIIGEVLHETSATPVLWLSTDFAENLPIAHVYKTGGSQSGPLAQDLISIDVYATGRDAAYGVAEEIRAFLVGKFHASDQYGLVDTVGVISNPNNIPYYSDTLNLFSATYRVDSRAI